MEKVSMIRNYHNHTLQTNPQHREEEPQNTKVLRHLWRGMSITQVVLRKGTR